MANITIYTTPYCPYCMRAKALLTRKGARFEEIDVSRSAERRSEMTARSGGRQTVPQIFIGERHIGGSDELHALDSKGGLDPLVTTDAH